MYGERNSELIAYLLKEDHDGGVLLATPEGWTIDKLTLEMRDEKISRKNNELVATINEGSTARMVKITEMHKLFRWQYENILAIRRAQVSAFYNGTESHEGYNEVIAQTSKELSRQYKRNRKAYDSAIRAKDRAMTRLEKRVTPLPVLIRMAAESNKKRRTVK